MKTNSDVLQGITEIFLRDYVKDDRSEDLTVSEFEWMLFGFVNGVKSALALKPEYLNGLVEVGSKDFDKLIIPIIEKIRADIDNCEKQSKPPRRH